MCVYSTQRFYMCMLSSVLCPCRRGGGVATVVCSQRIMIYENKRTDCSVSAHSWTTFVLCVNSFVYSCVCVCVFVS